MTFLLSLTGNYLYQLYPENLSGFSFYVDFLVYLCYHINMINYNIFIISDTHFGDDDFYTYKLNDGSPARPFTNADEADEYMINKWNSVVGEKDKIYVLGDLGTKKKLKLILPELKGKKCLIKGNHDTEKLSFYKEYFYDVRAYHMIDKILMAHIPVHQYCKGKCLIQAHGHTHVFKLPDKFYFNCCVENHDYTPVSFDVIRDYAKTVGKHKYVDYRVMSVWDNCYKETNEIITNEDIIQSLPLDRQIKIYKEVENNINNLM